MTPRYANTAEETWEMARAAAFNDGRFEAIGARELEHLRFEVSVVLPPEEITTMAELDPQRYGVVVETDDGRRGVLLPGLEDIDTPDEQVALARLKGGIGEIRAGAPPTVCRQKILRGELWQFQLTSAPVRWCASRCKARRVAARPDPPKCQIYCDSPKDPSIQ